MQIEELNIRVENVLKKNGRVRSRTGDLSHAKGARYQLRHTPCVNREKWSLAGSNC